MDGVLVVEKNVMLEEVVFVRNGEREEEEEEKGREGFFLVCSHFFFPVSSPDLQVHSKY